MFCCTSCKRWQINEYYNVFTGPHRSFDNSMGNFRNNENKWYKLDLYNDNLFSFSEISGSHAFNSGNGTWRDCGDYIILDFNCYERNQEKRELQEKLTGCTTIKSMCMVLKKKGSSKLVIYPSKAVLKR